MNQQVFVTYGTKYILLKDGVQATVYNNGKVRPLFVSYKIKS